MHFNDIFEEQDANYQTPTQVQEHSDVRGDFSDEVAEHSM